MRQRLSEFWFDLLLPGDCAGCHRPGPVLCTLCRAPLAAAARPAWPQPAPAGLPPPWSVSSYDGSVRSAVLAFKEHGISALTPLLSEALAEALAAAIRGTSALSVPGEPILVVPMPSSAAARRRRGDDLVADLTRRACRSLRRSHGWRVAAVTAVRFVRPVADSAGLSAPARQANLVGALGVRRFATALDGRVVILTDDVITTGATLAAAAAVIREAGGTPIASATIAATRRRARPGLPALAPECTPPTAEVGRLRCQTGAT